MMKLNDIEKKLQNYQEGSEYNVIYENNGEKRTYTINPGKALEFIRKTVANTPPPPFLSRPKIESNSIVEYRVEERNGVVAGQSFTVKTPSSGFDFGKKNSDIGNSFWDSSIFGVGRQSNNQGKLEFRQETNQDFSATKSQSRIHSQDIGICHCNSTVEKTLPGDCNRCLKCGGVFDDVWTEKAEKRRKTHFDNIKKEQENEIMIKENFNRFLSNENVSVDTYPYQQQSFIASGQQKLSINDDPVVYNKVEEFKINHSRLLKTDLIVKSSVILLLGGAGLLVLYLLRGKYKKEN